MTSHMKRTFERFCESTSLHGYGYLLIAESIFVKIFWVLVIIVMTCIGSMFLILNTNKYIQSRLVTTIESSTAPLKEAVFPSLTVCNFNQLEASFLRSLGIYGDVDMTNLLLKEYMIGREGNLTDEEVANLEVIDVALTGYAPYYQGRQWCRNLFTSIKFQGKTLAWSDIPEWDEFTIGPYYYGTDHGACCFFSPHINLQNTSQVTDWATLYHELDAPAKQGDEEGLTVLFDAEQFNHGFNKGEGSGLKISLGDHRDKPMMQFSSQYVKTGSETQMIIKPVITYTTEDAISSFGPDDRGCYQGDEVNLETLQWEGGFRYEINNCLIDQGLLAIYWNCRCYPLFSQYDDYWTFLGPCSGQKLYCANEVLKMMGSQAYIEEDPEVVAEEALESPNVIGNITRNPFMVCKPGCRIQDNGLVMSPAQYPPNENFFPQKSFCHVASHILQVTCADENRKYFLDLNYPLLCQILTDFGQFFGPEASCEDWPGNYYAEITGINGTLVEEMTDYGRENLAMVKVFFQSPYLTKIKRDVEMTFTDFVANTGGLLGLYLGFSIISLIEIIYWCCSCCRCKHLVKKEVVTKNSAMYT